MDIEELKEVIIGDSDFEETTDGVEVSCEHCGIQLSHVAGSEPSYEGIENVRHAPGCPITKLRVDAGLEFNPLGMKLFLYRYGAYDVDACLGVFAVDRKEADQIAITKLVKNYALTECNVEEIVVDRGVWFDDFVREEK